MRARRTPGRTVTPGRSVTCVNCAVERVFGHAPVQLRRSRPLIVTRGSLIIEVGDRPGVVPKVDE